MSASSDRSKAVAAKVVAAKAVGASAEALVELSHRIHAAPELSFEETNASTWCAAALDDAGFRVVDGVADLPTAFTAEIGSGPLVIGICCEYDALPDIGHACGHNVIAAAAVGAGLGLAAIADDLGVTVRVLGTPAEEGGGGKILMLDRGAFDGCNAALMVHPWPTELVQMPCLAVAHYAVSYDGRAAHASAFPELGVNAADALTIAQVAVALLRQHAEPGNQVHGIVTLGGSAPNIVPSHTEARYYVRANTLQELARWEPRIHACFQAGALGSGAELTLELASPRYSEFAPDLAIAALYQRNAERLGRSFPPPPARTIAASTDMANVSLAMPAIHPTLGLDSLPAVNHQAEFAAHCVLAKADRALLDGATAMAQTVVDCALDRTESKRLSESAYHHA